MDYVCQGYKMNSPGVTKIEQSIECQDPTLLFTCNLTYIYIFDKEAQENLVW